ncbi:hypothetical protein JXB28_02085 [Candidatus Woesearchaeota archaeon]|nr:hypothetical protein [Candidatus Woesearchaeota archaeon]
MSEQKESKQIEMPELVKRYFEVSSHEEGNKWVAAQISERHAEIVTPILDKARALYEKADRLVHIVGSIFATSHETWKYGHMIGNEKSDPAFWDTGLIEQADNCILRRRLEDRIKSSSDPVQKKQLEEQLKEMEYEWHPDKGPYLKYLCSLPDGKGSRGFETLAHYYKERSGSWSHYTGKIFDSFTRLTAREEFESMLASTIIPGCDEDIKEQEDWIARDEERIKTYSKFKKSDRERIKDCRKSISWANERIDRIKIAKKEAQEMLRESLETPYDDRILPPKPKAQEMTADEWDAQKDTILGRIGQYEVQ